MVDSWGNKLHQIWVYPEAAQSAWQKIPKSNIFQPNPHSNTQVQSAIARSWSKITQQPQQELSPMIQSSLSQKLNVENVTKSTLK